MINDGDDYDTRVHPAWKIYPSQTSIVTQLQNKKNAKQLQKRGTKSSTATAATAHGLLRVRSKTHVGRAAGLMRWSDTLFTPDGARSSSRLIYYIEMIKRLFMLITYRFPRAIREWQLWLMAASYGFYHLLYHGQSLLGKGGLLGSKSSQQSSLDGSFARSEEEKQRHGGKMDRRNRRIITSDNVTQIHVNEQLADSLLQQFEKVIHNDDQQRYHDDESPVE